MQQFESTLRVYSHCMASVIEQNYRQLSLASKLALNGVLKPCGSSNQSDRPLLAV